DSHLGDFIPDTGALAPSDAASHKLLKEQVESVLEGLTGRERRVLQLRFGLEDGRTRTLEEVGREFNVTRERIRQIEAKALRRLRRSPPARSAVCSSPALRPRVSATEWRSSAQMAESRSATRPRTLRHHPRRCPRSAPRIGARSSSTATRRSSLSTVRRRSRS